MINIYVLKIYFIVNNFQKLTYKLGNVINASDIGISGVLKTNTKYKPNSYFKYH